MERKLFALLAFAASLGLPAQRSDAGSTLYVSSTGTGQILSFDSKGSESVFASGLSSPTGLAVDRAGNVYVTAGDAIEKFSSTGKDLSTFASGLNGPGGLAIDGDGNVYVTLYGSNKIEKFSSTGKDLGTFASGLDAPNRVAVNSAGDVYVTNGYAGPSTNTHRRASSSPRSGASVTPSAWRSTRRMTSTFPTSPRTPSRNSRLPASTWGSSPRRG